MPPSCNSHRDTITESGGTELGVGGVADGQFLKRDGDEIVGASSGGGVTDHGALTGLGDDDHTQYALADGSRGNFEVAGALVSHVGAGDPHTQYHTDARGDARYAPIAKGVTNGDSHDHDGGDGAQIDHGKLGGLTDDDHSQYVAKDGRSGGQTMKGGTGSGEDLDLDSTAHATKGSVRVPRSAPSSPSTGAVWVDTEHLTFRDNGGSPATRTVRHNDENASPDAFLQADGSTTDRWYIAGLRRVPSSSNVTPTSLRAYALPLMIARRRTLNQIAVYVSSGAGAGGVCRFAVYANRGSGYAEPSTQLYESASIATTSSSAQAVDTPNLVVEPGLIWVGVCFNVAMPQIKGLSTPSTIVLAADAHVGVNNTFSAGGYGWRQALGSLDFPDPWGTGTTIIEIGDSFLPYIGCRFSA